MTKPHISEKATYLAEKNQYIFVVPVSYNKKEIKNSVEGIYNVDVLSVNKVKIPAKKRRIGATQGFKKGFVKAIVKIKEGQKIEVL
ncbi:MAG: 50S ribosomal protein L23 [Candidatus Staskawiczbacteria bacterium RIFOXYC1_FULL_37_43]|nr:MAG: 50S ribosomal protein L23 [Candidatus Staskawiczbacteria bacterium RIFCSPHIGHO2_01_FULL_37_17]OGZ72081.1 MAG: 50S ribosomal protein L23 [Candidatus Staskawiczbacteria bacterium RIFCSPLOWO2_01_FULL_37_19]OGZ75831.1 MAG: 50S ribosomal protein L23 [Candidatus Staskawiczbacteria bacterium RIFOXYA1_FULL_37_15]OGZ77264.1 MAG: 50S ribosomal protein L23 [Candidatus Staskawiczbacteria bacterium RIFOXYA12_FULL_37_10]OGZ80729.1 MAG: 50S ribosomal protein L23 [Candidatus Staskawiczbacteria bacteriu